MLGNMFQLFVSHPSFGQDIVHAALMPPPGAYVEAQLGTTY